MKTSEIVIGSMVETTKTYGSDPKVVLDVGRYSIIRVAPSEEHIVTWKGIRLLAKHWYSEDARVTMRRAILLDMDPSGKYRTLHSVPVPAIKYQLPDASVLQWVINVRKHDDVLKAINDEQTLKATSAAMLTNVLKEVGEVTDAQRKQFSYYWTHKPYMALAENEAVMERMVTLWLRYCQQTGRAVGRLTADEAYDMFVEATTETERATKALERATAAAEQVAAMDYSSPEWSEPLHVEKVPF